MILIVERRLRLMLQVHYRAEGQILSAGGHDGRTSLGEQVLVTRHHAFPERTVRMIDPFGAGGGVDVIARAVAERLAATWAQRVTVENHPGAGSTVAPALVANAPADGYTLLINTSAHAYRAALETQPSYQPLPDFVSVAALTSQPYVLVAGARSGFTTVTDLIDAAQARPGEVWVRSDSPRQARAPAPTSRWRRSIATCTSRHCTPRQEPPMPSPM